MKITKRVLKFDMVLDGVKIHSLDELREHPSTELLELQKDGRLSRWLRAHGCTNEADKLCEMLLSGNRARDLYAICQVLAIDVELEDILDALKEESSKDSVPSGDSVEDNSLRSDQTGPQQTRCESQQQNSQHAGENKESTYTDFFQTLFGSDQARPQQTRRESQQQDSQHAGESLWPSSGGDPFSIILRGAAQIANRK